MRILLAFIVWAGCAAVGRAQEAPDFDRLKELPQLDSITLSRTSLERLESLASLPRLRRLTLGHVSLTPEARKALKALPALEELKLQQMTLTEESLNFLPELKGLQSLTLQVYGLERAKLATLVDRMPDTSITFARP